MYRISYPTTSGGLRLGVSPDDLSQEARTALGITKGKMNIPLFDGLDEATPFKQWQRSQKVVAQVVSACGTKFMESKVVWSKKQVLDIAHHIQPLVAEVERLRDETYRSLWACKTPILDACNHNAEVKKILDGCIAKATIEGMTTGFRPEEVPIPNHTTNDEVEHLIASSHTRDMTTLATQFTEDLKDMFRKLADDSKDIRVRKEGPGSQAYALQSMIESLEPFMKQFSDSPDLISDMEKVAKVLKGCPVLSKGDSGSMVDVRERAKEVMAIFERPQAPVQVQAPENPFNDGHFNDADEFELDEPLPYPEVEPVAIYHPENEVVEQPATPARYGWGSDDNEVNF